MGRRGLRAVEQLERRALRGRLHGAVEAELQHVEVVVPVVLVRVAEGAQRGDERADLALGLAVRLRVARRAHAQHGAQQLASARRRSAR